MTAPVWTGGRESAAAAAGGHAVFGGLVLALRDRLLARMGIGTL